MSLASPSSPSPSSDGLTNRKQKKKGNSNKNKTANINEDNNDNDIDNNGNHSDEQKSFVSSPSPSPSHSPSSLPLSPSSFPLPTPPPLIYIRDFDPSDSPACRSLFIDGMLPISGRLFKISFISYISLTVIALLIGLSSFLYWQFNVKNSSFYSSQTITFPYSFFSYNAFRDNFHSYDIVLLLIFIGKYLCFSLYSFIALPILIGIFYFIILRIFISSFVWSYIQYSLKDDLKDILTFYSHRNPIVHKRKNHFWVATINLDHSVFTHFGSQKKIQKCDITNKNGKYHDIMKYYNAKRGELIVGMVAVDMVIENNVLVAELRRCSVANHFRSLKIGTLIVKKLFDYVRKSTECPHVFLTTSSVQWEAMALYSALGMDIQREKTVVDHRVGIKFITFKKDMKRYETPSTTTKTNGK